MLSRDQSFEKLKSAQSLVSNHPQKSAAVLTSFDPFELHKGFKLLALGFPMERRRVCFKNDISKAVIKIVFFLETFLYTS